MLALHYVTILAIARHARRAFRCRGDVMAVIRALADKDMAPARGQAEAAVGR